MDKVVKDMYEGYWRGKVGLEKVEDYERNRVLKLLFKKGEKVLDLACGEGAVSEYLQKLGCDVIGLDISNEALSKAKKRGIKVVLGDVENKLPFKDQEFDVIFWGDNVEHLFLPGKTLKEINRILKVGGRVIISTPNVGYWRYRLYFLLNGMMDQTEWFGKNPWEWEHIRFFNKKVMIDFLDSQNFKLKQFIGISRRRMDKPLLDFFPSIFGMIMVVEAIKTE